jgi:hypothetical protein
MSILSRFRVLTKIMILIGVLCASAISIAYFGIS